VSLGFSLNLTYSPAIHAFGDQNFHNILGARPEFFQGRINAKDEIIVI
jgi:hypothetical protein